ncbi:SusC/RagA family TonB-linked outer membrane protein [Mangrovimonas sp. ST2L15]|uniref:SusC/RagA family TonB-linked outer membrane protein n=1 Tax=Mangrovimonas sp. ST2L15 TaxID=1645916 RepID=UPI0006B448DB|nr:SusC/RagA family TonB-linked outer membrane protein [Mangrovimonas sp. ST2L15]
MKTKFSGILTLFLAFVVHLSFAQEKTISGTISDENGLPLPGVNIIVKGTTNGTQTDFDGNYSISASQGSVLVYTFVGYTPKEMTVGSSSTISFAMEPDVQAIDEVVISVLGTKRKLDEITTANQVVKAEELTQAQNPNLVQGLSGKVSGLQINTTNSGVNQSTRIVLRGNRSLTGNNQALIVIDGVISSSEILANIDPNLIESVNVIKGANGAALYGSQGSNGVFVVTTRKGGANDKFNVSVSSSASFENIAYLPQRQTRYGQGWNGEFVSYENGGWGPEMDGQLRPVGLPQSDGTYRYFPYSAIDDNIAEFFQTGTTFQNTISLSNGNLEDGYVFLSANKVDTEFIIADDKANRNTFNFKGGKKVGKWTLEGNVSYITSKTQQSTGSLYLELLQTATNIPVEEFSEPNNATHWTSYYRSPYWVRDNERTQDRFDIWTGIANVGYQLNDNIDILYNASIRTRQRSGQNWVNGATDTENVGGGDYTTISSFGTYNDNYRNYYGDLLINFNYNLTDDITLKANIGHNLQDNLFVSTANSGSNVTIPGFYNISNVTGTPNVSNSTIRTRRIGLFGNVDLGFKDFLFLNVTARNDWTSTLDPSNNSFFYPGVGLSFVPTEAFDITDGPINYMKIAASHVKVGNDGGIAAYETVPIFSQAANFPYGSLNSFLGDTTITDQYLEPEFVTSTEFNLNVGLFNDRVTFDGSYYFSKNTNQIANTSASYASGVVSSRVNIGETETKGFEIDLGVKPIWSSDPRGLRWEARFSYATNKTEVIKISDDTDELAILSYPNNANPIGVFAVVGEEFPTIKGSAYERDPQGRVIIDPTTGTPRVSNELQILGSSNPDYILGLNTSISFKGFRLSGVFDYRTGHQFWSGAKSWLSWSGHLIESAQNGRTGFIYPNSAIPDGNGGYVANTSVITGGTTYSNYLNYFSNDYYTVAENFVLDATAFKCRELSLSYSLSPKMLDNTALSSLTLGVNARNLFTILPKENRSYNDPETSNTTGNGQGLAAINQYPVTRSIGMSLNVTF